MCERDPVLTLPYNHFHPGVLCGLPSGVSMVGALMNLPIEYYYRPEDDVGPWRVYEREPFWFNFHAPFDGHPLADPAAGLCTGGLDAFRCIRRPPSDFTRASVYDEYSASKITTHLDRICHYSKKMVQFGRIDG